MSIEAILHGTPVWVWILLAYLLSRGFKAMKGGTAPLTKLAIVPVIFTGWGLLNLFKEPAAGWNTGLAWVLGAVFGIGIGVVLARRSGMTVDRALKTVTLPGSVVPLVLMLLTFVSKFWLGVELAVMHAGPDSMYVVLGGLVSGLVAGIFAGRFLMYCLAFRPVSAATMGERA
ncbi:DUF6622 family protein [Caballeronia sordidicola]|jgi:hypothetical protein|uniref:DUF1453 domain-containing protein n=1 Tax=Caballeronia sordidicola TaxID=196367 RepID=A0A242MVL1_CABSO|nr:DUF6622 family protein [Caballeronia sordidicola]MDP9152624.1 hypothetical protein [Pseudomonadota bacterium]OTP75480.1 hypothetical protein PAMC26510_13650 [Caballeronia sordidicola]